jgi:hypothetical protein
MQKIISYLYPNRIILLADLAGFNVENRVVYARTVKIYNGIDNTIQFDIQNADQKRIDLTTFSMIEMNVMDSQGNSLPTSPYVVTPTSVFGVGSTTIPQEDLAELKDQYLRYSVTAVSGGNDVMLYADSQFSAVGTLQLIGNAMPVMRDDRVYNTFTAEIDLNGFPINHSSAIPCKFYEAVKTTSLNFDIHVTGFLGTVWIEATTDQTISVESFRKAGLPFGSWTQSGSPFTGVIPYGSSVPVGNYNYFRVTYTSPSLNGYGANFEVQGNQDGTYSVTVLQGGTGYTMNCIIKILGTQLGGASPANDLYITVANVLGASSTMSSSYTESEISRITWIGTAANRGNYRVSGTNYSSVIDSITVS